LNSITVRQWEILRDPNRNLFGGFYSALARKVFSTPRPHYRKETISVNKRRVFAQNKLAEESAVAAYALDARVV
jgi:hypothetical protein